MDHQQLEGAGQTGHAQIDNLLPTPAEKDILTDIAAQTPPVNVTGSRAGNTALANLLAALEDLGLITDSTTAS